MADPLTFGPVIGDVLIDDLVSPPPAPGAFKRGLKTGVADLKSIGGGVLEYAGRGFGARPLEEYGKEVQANAAAEAAPYRMQVEDVGAAFDKGVMPGLGAAADLVAYGVGNQIPMLATTVLGGIGGRVVVGALGATKAAAGVSAAERAAAAARVAAGVGTAEDAAIASALRASDLGVGLGVGATSTGMELGQIAPEGLKPGADSSMAQIAVGALMAGALDTVLPLYLARKMGLIGAAERALAPRAPGIGAVAGEAGATALKAGAFEGAQETVQSGIERAAAGQPLSGPEAASDYLNSGVMGAIMGIMTGGLAGGVNAVRRPVAGVPTSVVEGVQPAPAEQPPLGLPSYAGEPMVTFPDGSTMTRAEYVRRQADGIVGSGRVEPAAEPSAPAQAPKDFSTPQERLAAELAGLQESESRDVEFLRAQMQLGQRKQTEMDAIAAARAEELGRTPDQQLAAARTAADETPTAMAEAFARAQARRAAPLEPAKVEAMGAQEAADLVKTRPAAEIADVLPNISLDHAADILTRLDEPVRNEVLVKVAEAEAAAAMPTPTEAAVAAHVAAGGDPAKAPAVAERSYPRATAEAYAQRMTAQGFPSEAVPHPTQAGKYAIMPKVEKGTAKPDVGLTELLAHVDSTIAAKGISDAKKAEYTDHVKMAIEAITAAARSTPETYRATFIKDEVKKQIGMRLPADVKSDIADHIESAAKTQYSRGAMSYEAIMAKQRAFEGFTAAVRDPQTGEIYTGPSHRQAISFAPNDPALRARLARAVDQDASMKNVGFIDSNGEFVTRERAEKMMYSQAAMNQETFDALPAPAQLAAVDAFNAVMREKGQALTARLNELVGVRPELDISTFSAEQDSPIGSYRRVNMHKSIITMALNAKDGMSIADHEGFHFAEDRLLSSAEVQIIANALKEGKPLRTQLMERLQRYDIENKTTLADEVAGSPAEARAYAFEFWRRGELKAGGALARVFQKLHEFFERVANAVRGLGFKSMEDIFTALDRGQFAERELRGDGLFAPQEAMASVAADQTKSPEFRRWFGDSKVVDAEGKPLVVYHGTAADFTEFKKGDGGTFGDGIYFAKDKGAMDDYADLGGGSRVMPAYVSIRNPASEGVAAGIESRFGSATSKELARLGYDGIITDSEVVAFRPEQIKSAIGNRGTFDPNNPNILYSQAATTAQAEMKARVEAGELESMQMRAATLKIIDDSKISTGTLEAAFGLTKDVLGGVGGSLKRWWFTNIATPNYVASASAAYKNVQRTLQTYLNYREILSEQMLREKLPAWYKANDVDRKAAFKFMLDRTVGGWTTDSAEYRAGEAALTPAQRALRDQATGMIEGFLRAQFEKDQVHRKLQLTSEGAYEKWYEARKAQVDELIAKGYVPLRRYGDFSVRVFTTTPDGKRVDGGLMFFDSEARAKVMAKAYQDEIARSGVNLQVEVGIRSKNVRDTGISIEQFLGTLQRNGVELSQAERERLVLTLTNSESMVRNRLMRREGLPGYSDDAMRVLHEFGVNMSGELAYAKFAVAIDAAVSGAEVDAEVDSTNSQPTIQVGENFGRREDGVANNLWEREGPMANFYKNLSDELTNFVLVPDHSGEWSKRLRSSAMVYFLGGSISGAAVNAMSVPMMVVPQLSVHTNYTNALATSMGAWKDAWKYYGTLRDIAKLKDPSVDIPGIDRPLREAIVAAANHIFDTEIHQMLGMSQGTVYSKSRNVQRAMETWMAPFRIAEQTNRLTAFIAAYRVASEADFKRADGTTGRLTGQELFRFARDAVDATQNNYSMANRPGAARHPVYAMMFMFKSFPLFMIEAASLMYKQNPRAAVNMLLGLTLLTGVQGLPFAGTLEDLIDTIAQNLFGSAFNSRRAMRNVIKGASEAIVGADLSDLVLTGALNEFLGISAASRIGAGDFVPGSRLGTADADEGKILSQVLGAPYAMVKDVLKSAGGAISGIASGDWKKSADALRAGGPIAVRNALKGAEQLETGAAYDAKGRKVVEVGTINGLLQLGGFSSAAAAKAYELESINIQTKAFYTQVGQDLQTQLIKALRDGDAERVQKLSDLRAEWNRENPDMPLVQNNASLRRAIMLAGVPLDRRSQLQWSRRIRGSNIFSEQPAE